MFHDSFASVPKVSTEVLQKELVCQSEELSYQIDEQVAAMTAWTQAQTETRKALRTTFGETGRQAPLKLLEVYCQSDSMLTKVAKQSGRVAERFTAADGDLGTPEGRSRLWQIIQVRQPAEIWMAPECGPWGSFARRNMGRSLTLKEKVEAKRDAQRQHLHLCNMIFLYQMERGRHFHLEQPLGSDAVKQPELRDVKEVTLRTCFDMCMVGKLQTSNGEYMRKRTVVHTTSRRLHELLDSRFCRGRREHRPIEGSVKGPQGWHSLSHLTARYTATFARQLLPYFQRHRGPRELPILWDEYLADQDTPSPEHLAMVGEIVKRRRLLGKQTVDTVC